MLSVSGPGALCVGPRGPAFSVGGSPALSVALSALGPAVSVSDPDALAVCVGPEPAAQICVFICMLFYVRAFNSDPCVTHPVCGPAPIRSWTPAPTPTPIREPVLRAPSSHPRATHLAAGPSRIRPRHPSGRGPSSDPRATHPARRVPVFQERTPNHTAWGIIRLLKYGNFKFPY